MFVILTLLSVVAASVPMLAFLVTVWWLDHNDREPVWLFALVFLWGALGATSLSLYGNQLLSLPLVALFGETAAEPLTAILVAPLVEEPTKALVLAPLLLTRHFDNATDGFVYGAAAGLGFGMTENALYFISAATSGDLLGWLTLVVIRTFFSAVMHAVATSLVGACVGAARFRPAGVRLLALGCGFAMAMGLHALWNGLATARALTGDEAIGRLGYAMIPGAVVLVFVVFQFSLWQERAIVGRVLAEEEREGHLPSGHAAILGSFWGRRRAGWLAEGVPLGPYVRAACTLALRRHASRVAPPSMRAFYQDDAERLRREVTALLRLATTRTR